MIATATIEKRLTYLEALADRQDVRAPAWDSPVDLADALGVPLHGWQRRALGSKAKRQIVKGPRQSGKSTISAVLSLHTAISMPESLTLLIAPAQRQSQELARTVRQMAATVGLSTRERVDAITPTAVSMTRLEFGNGSRILSLPGSTEGTIRGFAAPALIVCDEASRITDDVFAAIRPSLASSPDGRLVLVSSPWIKAGVFYQSWTGESTVWERVEVTLAECPHLSSEFIEEERRSLPSWVFDREYLGLFSDDDRQVFPSELIEQAMDDNVIPLFSERKSA